MVSQNIKFFLFVSQLFFFVIFFSCSAQLSSEEEVYAYIAAAEKEAETKDISGLKKLISQDYSDKDKRTRKEILQIAMAYFLRNKNINILTRVESVHFSSTNDSANATIYVAISKTDMPEDDIRLLQAEIHRFEIDLQKTSKGWLLKSTNWQRAATDDFLGD